jgi:hypothetical protein
VETHERAATDNHHHRDASDGEVRAEPGAAHDHAADSDEAHGANGL